MIHEEFKSPGSSCIQLSSVRENVSEVACEHCIKRNYAIIDHWISELVWTDFLQHVNVQFTEKYRKLASIQKEFSEVQMEQNIKKDGAHPKWKENILVYKSHQEEVSHWESMYVFQDSGNASKHICAMMRSPWMLRKKFYVKVI